MAMSPPSHPIADPPADSAGFVLDGRWHVRPDINRIFDGATEHQVPDKFMQVLVVLVQRPGVISRQELFDTVWPDTLVVDESLTRAISSLRKLLKDDPKRPRIIETIPKKGYRILAPVEALPAHTPQPSPKARLSLQSTTTRLWLPILAILIAVITTFAGWFLPRFNRNYGPVPNQLHLTSFPGIEEYPSLSPSGDRLAFIWDGNDEEPDGVFVQVIGAGPPLRLTHTLGHYAFPTWTHDSRFIAFARLTGNSTGIFMVPAVGGKEIEVVAAANNTKLLSPAFSPDGRLLVFARREAAGGPWQLQQKDLETGQIDAFAPSTTLSHGGYRPRFSANGQHLAFLRIDDSRRAIVVSDIDGSNPRQIPSGGQRVSDFDWAPDDEDIVVARDDGIFLIGLDGMTHRTLSSKTGVGAISVATYAPIIAFSQGRREKNIWQCSPSSTSTCEENLTRIIHSTAWDSFPAVAPDNQSIVFLSDRTGTTQLWLASRDGSDVHKLTELESVLPIAPTWSPNGGRIGLTVEVDGQPTTCIVDVPGGRTIFLQAPHGGETRPRWSHDPTALYVSRGTAERNEIWRRPVEESLNSEAIMTTDGGGYQAIEAPDGKALFFTRYRRSTEGIWRCEPTGGNPELVFSLEAGELLTWQVSESGLFVGYRKQLDAQTYKIAFFDFATQKTTELMTVPGRLGFAFDVDPLDGRTIVFDQTESLASDIFAIENF